ncbi:MAG TPA: putative colanic acid biosynthesis acetyltransferase [Acidobacteriaceae bacterium]|nr:putative colanic acid biosynthesis acetyltransferase [Acidobacteriaceae bacterium]
MPKTADYRADLHISAAAHPDPFVRPAFTVANRARRALWNTCWLLVFRPTPRPFHAWRSLLLRLFGATIGADCHIYPSARVWAPWNLICADHVAIGPGAEVYNPSPIHLDSHVILSQEAYLCGATHDYNDPAFPLLAYRMTLGPHAWICARASVAPGVNIGEGAVLGLASVATHDLEPWTVYAGSPAIRLKDRKRPTPTTTS